MRVLCLMRGAPGAGKSTFIKEHNLEQYKLCADDIRLLIQTPVLTVDGSLTISQNNEKRVWELLFQMLEDRMKKGEFTIIDATNSKTEEMNKYKKLADQYRYRMYIVDFTSIPIDIVKERNKGRISYKVVPEEAIDKMYARFETQKIPSGITVVKPEEFESVISNIYTLKDFSKYNKIHHIGDIHGCYTVLNEYLKDGLKDDELYIFVGDYLDRGIENAKVLNFLLSIYTKPNVILLTGNHEQHIYNFAHDLPSVSKEFEINTKPQLVFADIDKKETRQFFRKLGQFAYYKYNDKIVLVTHGGLSLIPDNFVFISTEQLIKGVGNYADMLKVNEAFINNTPDNCYQIHGHRNDSGSPIQINDRCFNLCGGCEFGGDLRVITLDKNGFQTIEIKNTVFKPIEKKETSLDNISVENLVKILRDNKFVQEKTFGNISSFNFSKDAFYDKVWNDITTKARGLFINTVTNTISARAYDKFFNIGERTETEMKSLQNNLKYPVTAYLKYNGYLGIVGYDEETNDLLITSKSSIQGDFADNFKRILFNNIKDKDNLKVILKNRNLSLIFEVIDPVFDPHIIKYDKEQIILLDAIYRTIEYSKLSYNELIQFGNELGLTVKEKCFSFGSWNELYLWLEEVKEQDWKYKGEFIEGFVLEDSSGFMTKVKLAYYNTWKMLRGLKETYKKRGYVSRLGALTTQEQNLFFGFIKTLPKETLDLDIIQLRDMFYQKL